MNYNYEVPAADDRQSDAAAGDSRRLPAVVETAVHRQVLRPARTASDHAGDDCGIQRRAESVPVHHELRRDGRLRVNTSTFIEGTYGFIRNQLAGGASIGATGNRWHPRQRVVEPAVEPAGLSAALPECRRGRPRYYAFKVLNDLNPVWFDGSGSTCRRRSGGAAESRAPPAWAPCPDRPISCFPGFSTSTARRTSPSA